MKVLTMLVMVVCLMGVKMAYGFTSDSTTWIGGPYACPSGYEPVLDSSENDPGVFCVSKAHRPPVIERNPHTGKFHVYKGECSYSGNGIIC